MAVSSGQIYVNKEAAPISGAPLESLFTEYNKIITKLPKLTQKYNKDIIINLMYHSLLTKEINGLCTLFSISLSIKFLSNSNDLVNILKKIGLIIK